MDLVERSEMLPAALDDATLESHRPAIRALLVKRLEELNDLCDDEMEGGKDLVRWGELKLRIVDRLAKLYRLDVMSAPDPVEEDAGADQERVRLSVTMQLDDLASRVG